jgi:class 3 adenylate cyclase
MGDGNGSSGGQSTVRRSGTCVPTVASESRAAGRSQHQSGSRDRLPASIAERLKNRRTTSHQAGQRHHPDRTGLLPRRPVDRPGRTRRSASSGETKTSGNCYMVISGVPQSRTDHLQDPQGREVPLRIGLAAGPVVAGVVGARKSMTSGARQSTSPHALVSRAPRD